MVAAFHQPNALDRTVHHRLGDRTGHELLVMRLMEHVVHGWDLARSIGVDPVLDPGVVTTILAAFEADPTMLPRCGYPVLDPGDLTGPDRLLALTGRRHA
jgi:uncharacterized protein (TIGR03086 family)